MAAWNELDRVTAVRRILVTLAALVIVVAIRVALDANDDNALGWTGYFVQSVLMLTLAGLCLGRLLVISHKAVGPKEDRDEGRAQRREGPLVTERSLIVALVAAVLIIRVLRGDGTGDLDRVALISQLIATGLLVAIGVRRVVLMASRRSAFSAWPPFWLCLFVSVAIPGAASQTDQEPSSFLKAVVALALFAALTFLLIGIYKAFSSRRNPE